MKQNLKEKREAAKRVQDGDYDAEETKDGQEGTETKGASANLLAPNVPLKDYLASGSRDKSIRIWEVRNARCVIILTGHDNWITDLCFHPMGRFLISVSDDKSMRCWDLSSGRCSKKLLNIHSHFVTTVAIKQRTIITGSVD